MRAVTPAYNHILSHALEGKTLARLHPASLHTAEDRMHDVVDPIVDSECTSINKSWWLLVTKVRYALLLLVLH
jgi:hypothetical protein